ncbi:hypothetical protein [Bibersteinia trehalosi]|uniref:hypothetical protein n=1 Tax=Bibersteinia trehalosi TaxID=47735 RepID=UPI00046D183E|nr:hypothetical protein [Bibersteinia trehalosi]TCT13927.1 hypothetical protein EDC51_11055 [Bibersteinia trehalosi]
MMELVSKEIPAYVLQSGQLNMTLCLNGLIYFAIILGRVDVSNEVALSRKNDTIKEENVVNGVPFTNFLTLRVLFLSTTLWALADFFRHCVKKCLFSPLDFTFFALLRQKSAEAATPFETSTRPTCLRN